MKIIDNKSKEIFNDAEGFWEFYCMKHELCQSDKNNICPLYELVGDNDCAEYFVNHVIELQNVLGYTVKEEKPLSNWTIKELREYCKSNNGCRQCNYFKNFECMFGTSSPEAWDINKYTVKEKDTAQFLINQFWAETVECTEDNENLLIKKDEKIIATVCKEWFPNVTEKTKLSDIVEE